MTFMVENSVVSKAVWHAYSVSFSCSFYCLLNLISVIANNLTKCEKLIKGAIEAMESGDPMFGPRCEPDGSFSMLQCWDGKCWCADKNGAMINGTKSELRTTCEDGMLM